MFGIRRQGDPMMPACLVHGMARRLERGIGKGAYGDGNQAWRIVRLPVNSRAAGGTEIEGHGFAAVAEPRESNRIARYVSYLLARKAGLVAEGATGPLLAGKTVADRHPHRLALAGELQLPAAARGPMRHACRDRATEPIRSSELSHRLQADRADRSPDNSGRS